MDGATESGRDRAGDPQPEGTGERPGLEPDAEGVAAREDGRAGPAAGKQSLPPAKPLVYLLAGLQGGMLGGCWMLAWLGVSAAWQQRSFWTSANLMASALYGERAIRSGFAVPTLSGLALYLLLYSTLGALFALAAGSRLPRLRLMLAAVVFALAWYYLSFHVLWKSAMPLVALLHSVEPMLVGHVIYGVCLGRYPVYIAATASAFSTPAGPR
jgi:hypothetical protein